MGWGGGGSGPCDFSVSPSPLGLDFGTLDFGTSDSGLTIMMMAAMIMIMMMAAMIMMVLMIFMII